MNAALTKVKVDLEEYQLLCIKYGEAPQLKHGQLDVYGEHANGLRARLKGEEAEAKREREHDEMMRMAVICWEPPEPSEEEVKAQEEARKAERQRIARAQRREEKKRLQAQGLLPPPTRFKRKEPL